MKKVLVFIVLIASLVGCTNRESSMSPDISPPQAAASSQVSEAQNDAEHGAWGEKSANYRAVGYDNNLLLPDNPHVLAPSTISLFIGEKHDEIGFLYEYGLDLTNEDRNTEMPKDDYGNTYLYFGKVNHVEENIYRVSGDMIPSWDVLREHTKKGVDFYVVLDEDKFYLVFQDLPMEELENYTSERSYVFNDN